jgi:kynurenine formamidase
VSPIVDLSRPLHGGMAVFPGDPAVEFAPADAQAPWQVTRLTLGTHSGTHIDAACHYVPDGRTIDQYPLERFVLDAWVVPVAAEGEAEIGWGQLSGQLPADPAGAGILLRTGWDERFGGAEAERHPYLSPEAAHGLVAAGVTLVGTDALNVDATALGTTHAHEALLGADVLVVENLTNLAALPAGRPFRCVFLPLRLTGADGSPIRACAFVD